jgi:hypothetical protein
MPTKKKQLQEYQVKKILQKRNIILFYQYSHAKVEEWGVLKKSLLDALSSNSLEAIDTHLVSVSSKPFVTLVVKNCLGRRCVTLVGLKARGSILTDSEINLEDLIVPAIFDQKKGKESTQSLFSFTNDVCKTSSNELMEEKGRGNFFQGPTLLFACDSHHQMIAGCNAINNSGNRHGSVFLIGGIYYGKTMTHLDLTRMCKLDQRVYASLACSLKENVRLLLNQRLCFYQSRLLFYLNCYAAGLCCTKGKSTTSLK